MGKSIIEDIGKEFEKSCFQGCCLVIALVSVIFYGLQQAWLWLANL